MTGIKFHAFYIAFSSVILQKTKVMKGSGQPKESGRKKNLKGKAAKGRGHAKPPQAKAGPTPAQVHASAAATGIAVPLGHVVPCTRARAAQKLPSFYEL